mmetsp:Transcript_15042/g.38678  ORF Transcript_15042/g.38678 Transcript_15042/m.38678 type:complete len:579 (-) Transcript_15042:369-2105(-)|eukprot:jgi/Tetstr1/464335/TSEL_009131.t1
MVVFGSLWCLAATCAAWALWCLVLWQPGRSGPQHMREVRAHELGHMRDFIQDRNRRHAAWRPPHKRTPPRAAVSLVDSRTAPPPLPRPPPPPSVPLEGPSTVCLAWRAYRGGGTCWATPPVRDPPRDRYCSAEVRGPGHCEVADVTYGQGGVLLGGVKRAVMTRQCGAFPAVVRCADAPEFAAFAAASLAFSYPAAAEARQAQQDGDPAPAPRGIVMAIHDGLVVSAYAVVRLLRHHGCALPVEMWAFPGELTRRHAAYLDQLVGMPGVALREVAAGKAALCKDPKRCFAIKPYALFHTRFDQVMLLDADNFPVRDPTYLFDTPEFRDTGALFWPDFWHPRDTIFQVHRANMVWELLGIPFVDMFEQESGQLLVDRTRHEAPLHLVMYYAKPENLLWRWNLVWGDKDLYRLAWMRAGAAFHMVQTPPGAAGQYMSKYFCGQTIVQHDPAGRPVFFHRNTYKLGVEPASREPIWDGYLAYRGSDPLRDYRIESWSSPPNRSPFKSSSCFGRRSPVVNGSADWEYVPLRGHPQLGDLEGVILDFAEDPLQVAHHPQPPHPKQPQQQPPRETSRLRRGMLP